MRGGRKAVLTARPDHRSSRKWHVVCRGQAACGETLSLCGSLAMPAGTVPRSRRCASVGCRESWPVLVDAANHDLKDGVAA